MPLSLLTSHCQLHNAKKSVAWRERAGAAFTHRNRLPPGKGGKSFGPFAEFANPSAEGFREPPCWAFFSTQVFIVRCSFFIFHFVGMLSGGATTTMNNEQ
jgi:hypothetical protein